MEPHWTDDAKCPCFDTVIAARGPSGNIFAILGNATRMLREIGVPQDRIDKLREDVMSAVNYEQAVAFIERWFPVDREED